MKLQERQNHSDKADQWLPRDRVGEGKAGTKGHKGTFLGEGTIILQLVVVVAIRSGREGQVGRHWTYEDQDRRDIFRYTGLYAYIFSSEMCDYIAYAKTALQFSQSQMQRRALCTVSAGAVYPMPSSC